MNDAVVQVVPMRFGETTLQVQATRVAGTERTSGVAQRVMAAYEDAEAVIMEVASSVAQTIERLQDAARRPRQVQVQFGLSVSVEGTVLVVKGGAGATIAVTLTYDAS